MLSSTSARFIRQLGKLLGALDDHDVTQLQRSFDEQQLSARESLFCAGDRDDRVSIVVSGRLKLYGTVDSGKDMILALLGPGELVGEAALVEGGLRQLSAEALEPSTVISLACSDFEALIRQRPTLALAVTKLLARRLLVQQTQLQRVVSQPVSSRLAGLLQDELQQQAGPGPEFWLKLTHQEVAQRIGTSRETVTALLSRFAGLGVLSHRGRRITINDPGKLAACASGALKVSPRQPSPGSDRCEALALSA